MNKHLKLFANHSAYSQAESNLDKPNVAVCLLEGDVHFNPIPMIDGHEYVDLGLPSGTLWATMNIGATSVTDYGNYYMYGMGNKTYNYTDTPYEGTENPLDSSKDTATQVWGDNWHMPTKSQIQELIANTTYQWVSNYQNSNINGGLFTALNGNFIFIPAAGCYYGSSNYYVNNYGNYWNSSSDNSALYFYNNTCTISVYSRNYGFSIRPVVG